MWDLIVSVPDRCLSFYFPDHAICVGIQISLKVSFCEKDVSLLSCPAFFR